MKKNKKIEKGFWEQLDLVKFIILLSPILGGFLSVFSNVLLGLICICGIIYKVNKNKKLKIPKGKNIVLILIYIFSFIPVSFLAVDKGMTLLGFFKNFAIVLFALLYEQYSYTDEQKKNNLNAISISGVISVAISLLFILFGSEQMFLNNRLQGLFWYANSYGMFLIVGIVILLAKKNYTKYDFISLFILVLGIILTNSRAVIILTLLASIVVLIFNKNNRKKILICCLTGVLLFFATNFIFNLEKRLDSDMGQSSEFLTRLLYYHDAVEMIKENPWGHGFLGWYYGQAESQTAMYYTKFVHNSVLQVLLDVGFISMICLALLLIFTFFDKKQNYLNRLILILVLGHSLIDIDLEYMIFIYLFVMMMQFETFEINKTKESKIILYVICIIYSWLSLGTMFYETENYDIAHSIIPFYTDAMQENLYSVTTPEEQFKVANKIHPLNKNVSGMYEAFSNECLKSNEYNKALEYQKLRLSLNKYTMENYFQYLSFLSDAIDYYSNQGNKEQMLKYMQEVCKIENIIDDVLENTNELSYRTIHPPEIEVTKEMKEFIEQVKNVMSEFE